MKKIENRGNTACCELSTGEFKIGKNIHYSYQPQVVIYDLLFI